MTAADWSQPASRKHAPERRKASAKDAPINPQPMIVALFHLLVVILPLSFLKGDKLPARHTFTLRGNSLKRALPRLGAAVPQAH